MLSANDPYSRWRKDAVQELQEAMTHVSLLVRSFLNRLSGYEYLRHGNTVSKFTVPGQSMMWTLPSNFIVLFLEMSLLILLVSSERRLGCTPTPSRQVRHASHCCEGKMDDGLIPAPTLLFAILSRALLPTFNALWPLRPLRVHACV